MLSSPAWKICYVTTILPTFRAFVAPVARELPKLLPIEISAISSASVPEFTELGTNLSYHAVPMGRGIDIRAGGAVFSMYRVFHRERYQIVEYTTPNASLYASLAAWLARVPIRIYNQGGLRYVGFKGGKRWLFKMLERLTCRLSTHVEPVSTGNLEYGIAEGLYKRDRGAIIWNGSACGVDLARFDHTQTVPWKDQIRADLEIPDDAFVVGFVGRLSRDKGGNELLTACRHVMDVHVNIHLIAVGGLGEAQDLAPDLLEWAESSASVHLPGTRQDVERHIAAMDCLVLPSYREGFGQVLIEAQAMGVPIITTSIPGPLDAVLPGVTAVVVPPGDVEALTRAIEALEMDRELCIQMGRAGVCHAEEKFAQAEFVAQLAQVRQAQIIAAGLGNSGVQVSSDVL